MKTSPPPRKTSARNPSHFGSYRNAPTGSCSIDFASIGSIGGLIKVKSQQLTFDFSSFTLIHKLRAQRGNQHFGKCCCARCVQMEPGIAIEMTWKRSVLRRHHHVHACRSGGAD